MNLLAHYRKKAQIKQADLAKAAGISQSIISHYENGIREPYEANAEKLIAILNECGAECTVADVFPFFKPSSVRISERDALRIKTRYGTFKKVPSLEASREAAAAREARA